jgi:hypothetical protein
MQTNPHYAGGAPADYGKSGSTTVVVNVPASRAKKASCCSCAVALGLT